MSCQICNHTMQGIGHGNFWCPRCGALLMRHGPEDSLEIPTLHDDASRAAQEYLNPSYNSDSVFDTLLKHIGAKRG